MVGFGWEGGLLLHAAFKRVHWDMGWCGYVALVVYTSCIRRTHKLRRMNESLHETNCLDP
jgi:hypothetical protein